MNDKTMKTILVVFLGAAALGNVHAQQYEIRYHNDSVGDISKASCLEILQSDPSATNGEYEIDLNGQQVNVQCNMDKEGGGWTRITQSMIANVLKTSKSVNEGKVSLSGGRILMGDRSDVDDSDGRLDITIPFGYDAFFFEDLQWRDRSSDNDTWDQGKSGLSIAYDTVYSSNDYVGDVTVGSAELEYPTMSYFEQAGDQTGNQQVFDIPVDGVIFDNGARTTTLSFRAFEHGGEDEDLEVFYNGSVWVR